MWKVATHQGNSCVWHSRSRTTWLASRKSSIKVRTAWMVWIRVEEDSRSPKRVPCQPSGCSLACSAGTTSSALLMAVLICARLTSSTGLTFCSLVSRQLVAICKNVSSDVRASVSPLCAATMLMVADAGSRT